MTDIIGDSATFQESFLGILLFDVQSAMRRHNAEDTQPSRRDLIRTTFAAVEGMAWAYREFIISAAQDTDSITREEELAFSEVSYQVTDQGKIIEQQRFLPLPNMIRLTTRLATKLSPNLETKFDTAGWEMFRQAVTIRNRITHPKGEGDLHVSAKDVSTCLAAFFWLLEISMSAMEAATTVLQNHLKQFSEIFENLKRGDPATLAVYEAMMAAAIERE